MITNRGFPVEIHQVTTEDGYILQLHRIPHGRGAAASDRVGKPKKVVFFQHGMVTTDHIWIMNPTDKALAYMLADLGYDVWLANSRGTIPSRGHVSLDSSQNEYWRYSYV